MPLLHLNYIAHYHPHLHCYYYFAAHTKHAILLHLAWLNIKKLGFTLFLRYSHKGWTAALVCCLLSTTLIHSTVNCTSATSYNYDATLTFFLTTEQCTTNDITTFNISCSTICTQTPVQLTGLLWVWARWSKNYIMTHQHTKPRYHFS